MKHQEMIEAKKLRKEEGMSITEIAKRLNVAKSSVSLWVRDVPLTSKQQRALLDKNPIYNRQLNGSRVRKENAKKCRLTYQEEGKEKAKEKSWLHMTGCMLYWAEGSKGRNSVGFCNTDIQMMKLFMRFLREEMKINEDKFCFSVNMYENNGITVENVENFWLDQLSLDKKCLRKSTVNKLPKSSKGYKKNKHIYGVGNIIVNDTQLVQHIYGAIQEYGGFINENWIK